jgi:hypothetical protein
MDLSCPRLAASFAPMPRIIYSLKPIRSGRYSTTAVSGLPGGAGVFQSDPSPTVR